MYCIDANIHATSPAFFLCIQVNAVMSFQKPENIYFNVCDITFLLRAESDRVGRTDRGGYRNEF